jgi:hypothetical protein
MRRKNKMEKEEAKKLTCLVFGFLNSTIQKFWEDIIKIIIVYEMNGSKKKRLESLK